MKMELSEIDELIALRLSNQISDEQNILLEQWLTASADNQKYFEQSQSVWNLADVPSTFNPDVEAAWKSVEAKLNLSGSELNETSGRVISIAKPKFNFYKIAAAVVVLLGISTVIYQTLKGPSMLEVSTLANETKEIILPDNSKIILNENSKVTYPAEFASNVRNIDLQGEAFFEVEKDPSKPFIVTTYSTYTKVLGTSFNIDAPSANEMISVSVATGKVEVGISNTNTSVKLLPGNAAIVNPNDASIDKKSVSVTNVYAWNSKQLVFEDQTLDILINDLENYFNVNINADANILNCHFTGSFSKPDLTEILNVLELTNGIKAERSGDTIVLTGKSCL